VIFTISARPYARAGYNIAGIGVSTLADWPEKISEFRRNREKMLRHFLRLIHHQHLLRQVYILENSYQPCSRALHWFA
jgi:hypothetical protein